MKTIQAKQLFTLIFLAILWGAGQPGAPEAFAQEPVQPAAQTADAGTSAAARDTVYIIQQKPPFESARPGFYLALGMGSAGIDVSSDDSPAEGLILDEETGGGGMFILGYAFHEGFALELRMAGYGYETNRADVYAAFAQMQLDAVTQFNRKGRIQPYVAGGIGFAVFAVGGERADDSAIWGGQVDFGGGVEWMFARHWGLALDYRFAIQRYQEKSIHLNDIDGANDTHTSLSIDGSGYSNIWSLRLAFSF